MFETIQIIVESTYRYSKLDGAQYVWIFLFELYDVEVYQVTMKDKI